MRTLLTGFGPFMNVVHNPSARIVEHFERTGVEGHELTTRILPVSFRQADEEICRLLSDGRFDVVLLMGVAAKADAIRLELLARNRTGAAKRDALDAVAAGFVRPGGSKTLSATMSTAGLVRGLREMGIAARTSRNAGDYVCNHTYYAALHTIAKAGLATQCLFVHLPADEVTMGGEPMSDTMPLTDQIRAIERILHAASGARRGR